MPPLSNAVVCERDMEGSGSQEAFLGEAFTSRLGFHSGEQGAPFAHGMRGTQCAVLSSGSCGLRGRWALSGRLAISTGHLRLARPLWVRKAPAARPAVAGPRGHVGPLGLRSTLSVTVHSGVRKTRLSPVPKRLCVPQLRALGGGTWPPRPVFSSGRVSGALLRVTG